MKNGKLFGLQLFAEAVAGKKIVYLYRILSTKKDHDATALAFTTENERTKLNVHGYRLEIPEKKSRMYRTSLLL